jgi:hypothetical protein
MPSDLNEINEQVRELLNSRNIGMLFELAKVEGDIPLWKRKSIEGKAYAYSGDFLKAQNSYLEAF